MSYNCSSEDKFSFINAMIPITDEFCNAIPGGFFVYRSDETEEILYLNKAMLRIFGCDTEEELRDLVGNSFKGIVYSEDYEKVSKSIIEQVSENPYGLDYVEYRIKRKDGRLCWVEDYGRRIHSDTYGELFYVFIEDVTDRMKNRMDEVERINNRLNESYAREIQYKKAILHDAVTFFEINLSADRFIESNRLGLSRKASELYYVPDISGFESFSGFIEAYTKNMDEKDIEDYRNFFNIEHIIKRYERGELEQNFESTLVDLNGKRRQILYTLFVGRNEFTGNIIALALIRDFTDNTMKQRMFMSALSKANARNVANQNYITNIANHVFTPLNSIRCFTGLISNNLSNADIMKYCLDRIDACCEELLEIMNKYTEVDGLDADMSHECDLFDMIVDIRQRIQPDISDKHILFNVNKSSVRDFCVLADTIRLEEVLWQLLDNAVKYTTDGGVVMLEMSEAEEAENGKVFYTFEVYNSGAGIDDDILTEINELFAKKPSDDECVISGGGMGLTLAKSFVGIMGGKISVNSKKGQGSTFTFSIPLTVVK